MDERGGRNQGERRGTERNQPMSKKIILFGTGNIALSVIDLLAANGDEIIYRDVRCGPLSGLLTTGKIPDDADFIISVYWPHILPPEVLAKAPHSVNFHPSLLPFNRGWYPHVWSIINGSPCGVTLHEMTAEVDAGPIWARREVPVEPWDTAGSLHDRCQREILGLFNDVWPQIACGELVPFPQRGESNYHTKADVDCLDRIELSAEMRVGHLLAILRARSFHGRGYAYFMANGHKVKVTLNLEREDADGKPILESRLLTQAERDDDPNGGRT
jgi:methionyl-tRNA formyltransferase